MFFLVLKKLNTIRPTTCALLRDSYNNINITKNWHGFITCTLSFEIDKSVKRISIIPNKLSLTHFPFKHYLPPTQP